MTMTDVIVETGPGWELVADYEDPPEHNHRDIFDATDDCPRCERDELYAEERPAR